MSYTIEFSPSAARQFKSLQRRAQIRLRKKIDALYENPYPADVNKLTFSTSTNPKGGLYRIRSGDYRVIYTVLDDRPIVLIVKIGHRREIYRRL